MQSRHRYQFGSLVRKKRKKGDCWEFRYYQRDADGRSRRRAIRVGSVSEYPKTADAERAVETLRLKLNADHPFPGPVSMAGLIARYIEEELPPRHSTQRSYLTMLNKWIRPRWGEYLLGDIKSVGVEQWLRSLPLAPKSKTHLRSLMHLLYENARRWEMIDRNPIELVRQSSRRLRIPRVLSVAEIHVLLEQLKQPYRTMVLVAVCIGLRASEIVGLQWQDFDWDNLTVFVRRGVVQARVDETKTEYSCRPLPLHPDLANALLDLRESAFYRGPGDWVFASDAGRPRWQETILVRQLKPAAVRAGIGKIGWHTFRHTYSTMLRSAGTDIKVQSELLRHANIATTMDVYTQAVSEQKREANRKVVEMVLGPAKIAAQKHAERGARLMGANGS